MFDAQDTIFVDARSATFWEIDKSENKSMSSAHCASMLATDFLDNNQALYVAMAKWGILVCHLKGFFASLIPNTPQRKIKRRRQSQYSLV